MNDLTDEIENEAEDQLELDSDNQEEVDGEGGEQAEAEEVEIVLEGDEGSQPESQSNLGIRKRVNKLNAKVSAAEGAAEDATTALELERQKNKLLQLALEQQNGGAPAKASGPPDPFDFDDGAKDAKYVDALQEYNRAFIQAEMQAAQEAQPKPVDNRAVEARQVAHYEAAEKLGVKDYAEAEDKTIEILGQDTAVQMIGSLDNSPQVMYYLGKNPGKAEQLKELLAQNPVKGVLELGRLSAGLTTRPKAKRNAAPDPDSELEGSSVTRNTKGKRGPAGATFS